MAARSRAGVIGNPIAHSLSPQLHQAGWGATEFSRIKLENGQLADFLAQCDSTWAGCAITMPFKFVALHAADMVDGLAKAVGAANTIVFQPTGSHSKMTVAFNTDVAGIVNAIREVTEDSSPDVVETGGKLNSEKPRKFSRAVILGSGATAASALAALMQLGATQVTICARKSAGVNTVFNTAHRLHIAVDYQPLHSVAALQAICASDVLISTLPAKVADPIAQNLAELIFRDTGSKWAAQFNNFAQDSLGKNKHPRGESLGASAAGAGDNLDLLARKVVLDVAYDPYPSKLVQITEKFGAVVVPGWLMLLHQAVDQARLFTGRTPDIAAMRRALASALAEKDISEIG